MPTPCTNCVRFHFGECHEATKKCHICQGFNHIERYCPNRGNAIRRVPGEPLAGTREWQEWHGLQHDPELKFKILQALKTSPGTPIFVNGICIYRGHEKHFGDDMKPRGRTLEERMGPRPRSHSPERSHRRREGGREYGRLTPPRLDRSPPRGREENDRGGRAYDDPTSRARYRDRSPIRQRRRSPSPYRQQDDRARSPKLAAGSSIVVFEARDRPPARENQQQSLGAPRPDLFKFKLPVARPPAAPPSIDHLSQQRPALGDMTNRNVNPSRAIISMTARPNLNPLQGPAFNPPRGPAWQTRGLTTPPKLMYDPGQDPYFVLRINRGARDDEIVNAYENQMRDLEEARRYDVFDDRDPDNVWDDSIRRLNEARRQLLGR